MSERHYTYRAEWSPEDGEYVGLVAEFPSLSWLAPTPGEAIIGIERVVDDVVEDLEASGEPVPQALADRRYSGKIALRTSPDLHRRLTVQAAERGVSLNQWIGQRLAESPTAAESFSVGHGFKHAFDLVPGGVVNMPLTTRQSAFGKGFAELSQETAAAKLPPWWYTDTLWPHQVKDLPGFEKHASVAAERTSPKFVIVVTRNAANEDSVNAFYLADAEESVESDHASP